MPLIGEMLIKDNFINEEQLEEALKEQIKSGKLMGMILIDKGYINEHTLTEYLKRQSKN